MLLTAPTSCMAVRASPRCGVRIARQQLRQGTVVRSASKTREGQSKTTGKTDEELEETTRKYGLEAGIFKAVTKEGDTKDKMASAKDLLKRYGSAYLATSISLSLVSFSLFYVLIDNGVDVAALLSQVGITVSDTSEKVGTAALAYAAHKAASPIRFPPTVALTPLVARWMGKEVKEGDD